MFPSYRNQSLDLQSKFKRVLLSDYSQYTFPLPPEQMG